MAVIVDTSCLITLSKIEKLHLLKQLYNEIIIPEAVYQEYDDFLPEYIKVFGIKKKNLEKLDRTFLGRGEYEVIALALEKECEGVVIDEKKGRKIAREIGLKVIGTIGVLIQAKNKDLIPDIQSVIEDIKNNGFRISEKQLKDVLKN